MDKTKKIATYGVMAALAMILSYVEMQLPAFVAIPGVKMGLTNIVVIVALYKMGNKSAIFINIVRIIAVSLLFGTLMSFAFSFAGGMLSTLVMILLKKTDKFSTVGVSVAGGITHNIGQILAAMLLLNTKAIIWYLPVLWLSGILSGLLIGLIGAIIVKRIKVSV
ncbi:MULTISPECIES: Gx transporter family protein [Butyrivibrio]|uniref:Heptaprenyl diphosphate synthase n=1 Tax=Butyrivibrio proteoclasticus TaxID=43305 RepID=A0A1I5RLU0_9FIRM|nr:MULTISPECIES: Gx transporter family protein [Butyrivibrio]MBQ6415560.1 Gx transporter family protein [Butyrivibrio sp.]MBQ9302590.1 Gx transporter family protein [Butyrivibrio sp.]SFP59509.1 heptaprenyl diphosphate synthase [Butyrivibrio proteoclasticus]